MIAFCLDRLGLDPAFLIGGEVPQLGGNARAGSGWLVVEGDESDRSVGALRPEIAVLLNVDLDHHTTFASRAEVESFFEDWLREVPHVVRAEELEPVTLDLAVPGEHNRRNAAAALAALELAGVPRADAERRSSSSAARAGGSSRKARRAASPSSTATPTIQPSSRPTSPRVRNGGRLLALFQPHLYSRTLHLAHGFAEALAGADAACVTEIYPRARGAGARRERAARSSTSSPRCARACASAGRRRSRTPRGSLPPGRRPGDTVLTLGAGDVDRAAALILEALA